MGGASAAPLLYYATLESYLTFPKLQFSHLQNDRDNSPSLSCRVAVKIQPSTPRRGTSEGSEAHGCERLSQSPGRRRPVCGSRSGPDLSAHRAIIHVEEAASLLISLILFLELFMSQEVKIIMPLFT